ncbi:hypothetical protein WJX73_003880 [Symbiochloris irregularis]|uniref:SnoaL-like domain-containing protein n=1 Tax=Symbiochloris irregularis TaxID=706552 RepID=A0AAW1PZ23_9CHLO
MPGSDGPLTKEYVRSVFQYLEGSGMEHDKFGDYLVDDLSWTIQGTHPLAGHYKSKKAFQEGALKRIGQCLKSPLTTKVSSILLDAPWAVVEMTAHGVEARAGWPYNNKYCWVCRFEKGMIAEVRAYLDGVMVTRAISEHESSRTRGLAE